MAGSSFIFFRNTFKLSNKTCGDKWHICNNSFCAIGRFTTSVWLAAYTTTLLSRKTLALIGFVAVEPVASGVNLQAIQQSESLFQPLPAFVAFAQRLFFHPHSKALVQKLIRQFHHQVFLAIRVNVLLVDNHNKTAFLKATKIMKKNLPASAILTILQLIIFSVGYTIIVWGGAKLSPNAGKGFVLESGGKTYYANIAQKFTEDRYFYSRPSAVDYNAAGSAGSNKGPSNPDHLAQVSANIDSFLAHNPGVARKDVPADLVTASGSGLDPHISPEAAAVQAPRVARARGLSESAVRGLIARHTEGPLVGLLGPSRVHVLRLNLALDAAR